MNPLSQLKKAAIDAEAAFQDARAKTLKHLASSQQLQDCAYCARAFVADRKHPSGFWRCRCSPEIVQKAARSAA